MKTTNVIFMTFVAISLNRGPVAAQPENTRNYLWKQCVEPVLVLSVKPAPFAKIVGSDFALVLDDGKATVAIIVQDCSQYWIDGEDLGPTQHAHVWVEVEGSGDARPVVGAEQSFPTKTWFSLFAGSTNPRGRKARSSSGTAPESIKGVSLDCTDSPGAGEVKVSPTLSYSWQVEPVDQPARLMGFNNDVYVRTSSGNLILKRIQALANTVQSKGTLKVVGGIEPQGLIGSGSYSVRVLTFLPVWARATLGESPVEKVREWHRRYMEASNAHDLETLRAMTSDDVVWHLRPWTLVGKEQALLPNENDLVMNTTLEVRNVRIRGNIVEREVVERNDALHAVGMESWRHYSHIVFDDQGLVIRKEAWKQSPDDLEAARRFRPFRQWVAENHPDAVPNLNGPPERAWGREPAQRMRKLREEWIAAGRPGFIEPN